MDKIKLNSLTLEELEDYIESIDEKKYRAEQLFTYMHKNQGMDIDDISVFSIDLREKLKKTATIKKIDNFKRFDSKVDETKKYLFSLEDDNIIESVAMKYKHGITACISTQVGCKMGCEFCASTRDGLIRNLSSGEMVSQIYMMEKDLGANISNIVLMGSGEPLDNYENTLKFLDIIHHEKGHNISYRSITLSTCGIVPKIYKLADEEIPITLSISLHSPFDKDRKKIMPIANRYSIDEIVEACRYYESKTNRRITIEYTLIHGVNDREKDANKLIERIKGMNFHVNLIPLNPITEFDKEKSSNIDVERFKKQLEVGKIPVTIRREMGGDIDASCGQLRNRYTK